MPTNVNIIRAQIEHSALIAPLFDAYRQFYKQPPDLDGAQHFITERLESMESVIFLALQGERVVGFTQLYPTFSSISMRPMWILNDLFVIPSVRQQGVGQALLERARQFVIETGAKGLELSTSIDNMPAQRLYEKLGWQRDIAFYSYYLTV